MSKLITSIPILSACLEKEPVPLKSSKSNTIYIYAGYFYLGVWRNFILY